MILRALIPTVVCVGRYVPLYHDPVSPRRRLSSVNRCRLISGALLHVT